MTNKDLPEDMQTSYDALKYLFESSMTRMDAEDALADLEVLVAPLRAAERYVAVTTEENPRAARDIDVPEEHQLPILRDNSRSGIPPTLLDLVIKAQEREEHKDPQIREDT